MRTSISLLFLGWLSISIAQVETFLSLGLEDGLAQSQVNQVWQDKEGYLWAATVGGLSRYDGVQFESYYKDDGLGDNDVACILETSDALVFGTQGGITIYDGGHFSSYPLPAKADASRVTHLSQFGSELWISTSDQGLWTFSLSSRSYLNQKLVAGKRIRFADATKHLISGDEGLFVNGLLLDSLFHQVKVTDVVEDGKGAWASSLQDGLFRFTEGRWQHYDIPLTGISSSLRDLCMDSQGRLWVATRSGILQLTDGVWNQYDEDNGLDYSNIRSVHEDREGNIWFASNGQGIFRYSGGYFKSYIEGNPLPHAPMLSCIHDGNGDMLMGMFNEGLLVMRPDGKVDRVVSSPKTDIWAMSQDPLGQIWLGTSSGLYSYADGRVRLHPDAALQELRITSLLSREGHLVIGHRNGVIEMDLRDGSWSDMIPQHTIRRVRALEMKGDTLLIGAENGLFLHHGNETDFLTEADGLNDNTIYCLKTLGETVFIGTKTGLHRRSADGQIERLAMSVRAASSPVNLLHITERGVLYAGTNLGLFRCANPRSTEPIFQAFQRDEGLPGLEFNLNAAHGQGDFIWMGLSNAVICFEDEVLSEVNKEPKPRLAFRSFRLFAEVFDNRARTDQEGVLNLNTQERHLTFDFQGIWLSKPEAIYYSYRLLGTDETWSIPSDIRSVTYSDLSFGRYRFEAKALDAQGRDLGPVIAQDLIIATPLLLRPWAVFLELLLLALLIWLIWQWRKQVAARKRENLELGFQHRMNALEQQSLNSNMNRHFIFNALNAIQYYINREDKRAANRYLSRFAKLIRKNLDSTSHTWVELKDEIERLELYLELEKMRFKDRFDYQIHLDPEVDVRAVKVPGMMLQPFFENSIWHGLLPKEDKGLVQMHISREAGNMVIRIEDNGIGIEQSRTRKSAQSDEHESRGMDITQHRIELLAKMTGSSFEMRGPIQLESDGQIQGTRTELILPIFEAKEALEDI